MIDETRKISKRIESLRTSINLSQEKFSELIGVKQRQGQVLIHRIEEGSLKRFFDALFIVRRIAEITNTTVGYIITGVSDNTTKPNIDKEVVRERLRIAIGKTNVPIDDIAKITNTDADLINSILTQKVEFKLRYFLPIIVLYRININYVLGLEAKIFDIENNVLAEMINIANL